MKYVVLILASYILFTNQVMAENEKVKMDRSTLCHLEFGQFDDQGNFLGSTPIQDACNLKQREMRLIVCQHNYKDEAVINACVSTYDAITYQLNNNYK